jgi:apolipoprotein N-acyltransferase
VLSAISAPLLLAAPNAVPSARAGFGSAVGAIAVSALLYGAMFPPLDLDGLALVALAPYLWALSRLSPGRAAAAGALWAVLATAGTAWWLPKMLGGYFGLGPAGAWLGLAGVGLLTVGPWQAAFAAWLAWRSRRGMPSAVSVGAAWAVLEFARAHAPIPNPVGLLAYSQTANPMAQSADLAGPYGVGALLVFVNFALVKLFRTGLAAPNARRTVFAVAATLAASLFYGEWRLGQRFDEGEPLRVALVQGAVVREPQWDRSTRDANLEQYLALTRTVAAQRPDLVFWPEFAVDFYLTEPTPYRAKLFSELRTLGVDLVTGASHYELGEQGTRYYNSVFLINQHGRLQSRYDKTRLMPFAEYGPLGDWMRSDAAVYDPGAGLRVLSGTGMRVGAFVCGESLFPEVARGLSNGGAELLANPSNDYWFADASGAQQHLQVAALRAIENRRWLVRPTATGISAVIDPHGRTIVRSRFGDAETLEARVRRSSAVTPYQRWGDAPVAVALVGVICSSGWRRRGSSWPLEGELE